MAALSLTKLYGLLSDKLGKETAENLTSYIEQKMNTMSQEHSEFLVTKIDLANTKTDMIKWMFIFWIGQVAVITGLVVVIR